jgi:hypothetical protein
MSHTLHHWCENGTICARKLSDYTAEVKGNAAYGDRNGVIGTFGLIWRQNFNGPYPRWRVTLHWHSGPRVEPQYFKAQCRRHVSGGSDAYCGSRTFYPGNISSGSPWKYSPGSSSYFQSGTQLSGGSTRKYHDDLTGEFIASGHPYIFKAGTLHTGRWNRCGSSTGCKYYQVPWTTSP